MLNYSKYERLYRLIESLSYDDFGILSDEELEKLLIDTDSFYDCPTDKDKQEMRDAYRKAESETISQIIMAGGVGEWYESGRGRIMMFEELDGETYLNASDKLKKLGYTDRADKLKKYGIDKYIKDVIQRSVKKRDGKFGTNYYIDGEIFLNVHRLNRTLIFTDIFQNETADKLKNVNQETLKNAVCDALNLNKDRYRLTFL